MIQKDPNTRRLLQGVEPTTEAFLVAQGHRYLDKCPDYVSVTTFIGIDAVSALSTKPQQMVIAAVLCSCGVVVKFPL